MATEDGHVASSDSEPEGEEFRDRTQSQPDDALVIGEFSSFKQAGDFVDCHSSYRFKVYHKSARVGAMITTYRCASHLSCTYFLRLHLQDSKHTLQATGAHAEEMSNVAKIGINRAILGEVDSLLRGNAPKACPVLLDKVCANNPEKLRFLPTEKQLKNRKQYLSKLAAGKSVRTYADLLKWAGGRLCETQVFFGKTVNLFSLEADRVEFVDVASSTQNDVIVLGCFSDASDPDWCAPREKYSRMLHFQFAAKVKMVFSV
ncbi:hypothetical protein F442_12011 [Phytophthora nicotianae P10297]|uniref:Uncharacterized protein n=1 Tax=Phytophthora nicotianae P10297 TaxID=1317064 RepID=W2Z398_PHYNI|nr:hypothetical protein F442_12011 [Phytophthora nicotianae P10297]